MNFVINLEFIRKVIRIKDTTIRGATSSNEINEVKLKT